MILQNKNAIHINKNAVRLVSIEEYLDRSLRIRHGPSQHEQRRDSDADRQPDNKGQIINQRVDVR